MQISGKNILFHNTKCRKTQIYHRLDVFYHESSVTNLYFCTTTMKIFDTMRFIQKIIFLMLANAGSAFAFGQGRTTVSLAEALNLYVYNTRNVRIYQKIYENTQLKYRIYRKSLLPSIEMNVVPLSFNHNMKMLQNYMTGEYYNVEEFSSTSSAGLTMKYTVGATGGALSLSSSLSYLREFTSKADNFSTSPLFASYTQQLLGGRKTFRYNKRLNEMAHAVALKNYCSAVAKEGQTILRMYLDAYVAKTDKEYYATTCAMGDTLVRHARLKLEAGKITEYDLNRIELQHMENYMNLAKAREEYAHAIRILETELQLQGIDVSAPCAETLPDSLDCEDVTDLIRRNNPEYHNSELKRLEAEYALHTTRLENRFNANISLSYGLNQYARTIGDAYRNPNQQQSAFVTLSIPVFEWGANRDRIRMARNDYEAAVLEQEGAMDAFREKTMESVHLYNRCAGTLDLAEKRFALSRRQYEFAVMRFALGKLNTVELISAEDEQQKAKQEYTDVLCELYTNYYQIRTLAMYDFSQNRNLVETIRCN